VTASAVRPGLDPEWLAERSSDDRLEVDLRVPAQLDVWPGHFPGYSLVPGVLQLDWVIRIAAARLGIGAPRAVEQLKFKTPLLPRQPFTLCLERGAGGRTLDFRLTHGESIFAVGRLELEATA
jgi:3-hydroxymyristoyl/3-hydroxydecanoyl-(acyl carrier protein) dehydratase